MAGDESRNPWTVRGERRVFDNPWIAVDERDVVNPAGRPAVYAVVRFKKLAVGVAPIDAEGRVRLVGQWRFPLGRYSWEIPEGGGDPGETPAETARRELVEETGLSAGALREILRMDLSNSVTDEEAVIFLAHDLTPGAAAPEETEILSQRAIPFREALEMAVSGAIRDSLTVAGLLRAHHMAVTGALDPALTKAMLG